MQSHCSLGVELPFGTVWEVLETVNYSGRTIMQVYLVSLNYPLNMVK